MGPAAAPRPARAAAAGTAGSARVVAAAGAADGAAAVAAVAAAAAAEAFDPAQFDEQVALVALPVRRNELSGVLRALRGVLLQRRTLKHVVASPSCAEERLVLLDPAHARRVEDVPALLSARPEAAAALSAAGVGTAMLHRTVFGYAELTMEEALRKMMPAHVEQVPSSFEAVGHVAHVNLRDEARPYRRLVGRVLLDKNPGLRTVVSKTGVIENEFRTLPLEVVAGDADLDVEVREYGAVFRFNFERVYWNSRLQEEHRRLVQRFAPSEAVVDAFCGVGPFAIPAAQKGCRVWASDLNPDSYASLVGNIALNRVERQVVRAANVDARPFIRETMAVVQADHLVMNLPASGLEFLDALRGAFPAAIYDAVLRRAAPAPAQLDSQWDPEADRAAKRRKCGAGAEASAAAPAAGASASPPAPAEPAAGPRSALPWVHCYCFSNAEDFRSDIVARAEAAMGVPGALRDAEACQLEVRLVRDVAPNKHMYCLHFQVPAAVAQG